MRFRQIHLDFHTSPFIPGIGEQFDKKQWQKTLQDAAVDSITLFATCHHGYAYYNTKVGERHPHLSFDLLRAQVDACHEIGIKTPIYLTAGLNNYASEHHPEWGVMEPSGKIYDPLCPHFHLMCFNTPYLDFLCAQIQEVIRLFPDGDGIFTDIIGERDCCCKYCMQEMAEMGLDASNPEDRKKHAKTVLMKYYQRVYDAVKSIAPQMPLFHNSGHVSIGSEDILKYFSHLELESLPTGGWGYDHFPMSAAYVRNFGLEFLGMTGKFHTTWGEFGGFKHPNALRYECAAMIANGAKCSVGDQLHPGAKLDESTYRIIGEAYREVREKEPWCDRVTSVANLAILSANTPERHERATLPCDTGASRILLEAHIPHDFVDATMDWSKYRFLLLPDEVRLSAALAAKLKAFQAAGGKLILSGTSGMMTDKDAFALEMPFEHDGCSPYQPDYVKPSAEFAPNYLSSPYVMYLASQRIKVRNGVSLGEIYDPYFNRTFQHFSSHQHTPFKPDASGYDAGVMTDNMLYFAHPVFSLYRAYGAVVLKEYVVNALRRFIGSESVLNIAGLPSQGRVTLMEQQDESRYVLHLLYANTILRGGVVQLDGGNTSGRGALEVIEELNPASATRISIKIPRKITSARIVPSGEQLAFTYAADGRIELAAPSFTCHCMIELKY